MRTLLSSGAAVMDAAEADQCEGTRRFRVTVSNALGARDIAQSISSYAKGIAPTRRNPTSEETLYVTRGAGRCTIDGHTYELSVGTGVYIPPSSVYQIENTDADDLEIVSVCCPEDAHAEVGVAALPAAKADKPARTVDERNQKAIPVSDRTFKYLVNKEVGCQRITQFVGVIPPGRAPMHHHTYEEAIYILAGEGEVHTETGSAAFCAGSSIYLPRGVRHTLENTGATDVILLGAFYPSGSPGEAYES